MEGKRFRAKIDLAKWAEIKRLIESGVSASDAAIVHGCSAAAIRNKSVAEGWMTARRRKKWGAALLPKSQSDSPQDLQLQLSRNKESPQLQLSCNKAHSLLLADLEKLALAPPADFQAGLARVAQSAIAQGLKEIPIPQNIKELQTFFGIWRQASGLADKAGAAGSGGLFDPLRTVTRTPRASGPVVDVAPSPVAADGAAAAAADLGPGDEAAADEAGEEV